MNNYSNRDYSQIAPMPPEVAEALKNMTPEEIRYMAEMSAFAVTLAWKSLGLVQGQATNENLARANEISDRISRAMYMDSIDPPRDRTERRALERRLKKMGILR